MRVTDQMMTNQGIFWLGKQKEKLNEISTIVASGKQINVPSDDPEAMGKILSDRATISQYSKYISNIGEANTWIEAGNTTLETATSLLESAQDIVESADDWSDETAQTYIGSLQSLYSQIVDLANTKLNGTYLYGGGNSLEPPYSDEVSISGGTADSVLYGLADDAAMVAVTITDSQGEVVRTLTASDVSAGSRTLTWDGKDDDGNTLSDGAYSFTVSATDSSGDAVAAYAAYRGAAGGKEVQIDSDNAVTLNNDGSFFSDALCLLSKAIVAMKASSYTDALAGDLSAAIDTAKDLFMSEQIKLANVSSQLEISDTHLDSLLQAVEDEASALESADTETAAVQLESQQTSYEVTLKTVSSLLKMSKLTDYI